MLTQVNNTIKNEDTLAFDLRRTARLNNNFIWVFHTTIDTQVVLFSLTPGEFLGVSRLPENTCILQVHGGSGIAQIIDEKRPADITLCSIISPGDSFNVINTGDSLLSFSLIISPPYFQHNFIQQVKPVKLKDMDDCSTCKLK